MVMPSPAGRSFHYALLLALQLLFCVFARPALAWEGTVLSVQDGDSLTVRRTDTSQAVRVRLYGVDAPELAGHSWSAQPFSGEARGLLLSLTPAGSRVSVVDMGVDRYGRSAAAVVSLPGGHVVQEELLRAGLAWVDPRYCGRCVQWKNLQEQARRGKAGLWREGDDEAVPPWIWRHGEDRTARKQTMPGARRGRL